MQTEIVGIILSALPFYSRQQFWALYMFWHQTKLASCLPRWPYLP